MGGADGPQGGIDRRDRVSHIFNASPEGCESDNGGIIESMVACSEGERGEGMNAIARNWAISREG